MLVNTQDSKENKNNSSSFFYLRLHWPGCISSGFLLCYNNLMLCYLTTWVDIDYCHKVQLNYPYFFHKRFVIPSGYKILDLYRGADKFLARHDWKKQLKCNNFSSDAEVIAAAETWLDG